MLSGADRAGGPFGARGRRRSARRAKAAPCGSNEEGISATNTRGRVKPEPGAGCWRQATAPSPKPATSSASSSAAPLSAMAGVGGGADLEEVAGDHPEDAPRVDAVDEGVVGLLPGDEALTGQVDRDPAASWRRSAASTGWAALRFSGCPNEDQYSPSKRAMRISA